MSWPLILGLGAAWLITVALISRDTSIMDEHRKIFVLGCLLMPAVAVYYWIWKLARADLGGRFR